MNSPEMVNVVLNTVGILLTCTAIILLAVVAVTAVRSLRVAREYLEVTKRFAKVAAAQAENTNKEITALASEVKHTVAGNGGSLKGEAPKGG